MRSQWKELEYLHTNFMSLATSAAVLLGFGIASFGLTDPFELDAKDSEGDSVNVLTVNPRAWRSWYMHAQYLAEGAFFTCSAFAVAWNLLALFIASISMMCGPGMALRGPPGAVGVSVHHLEVQLRRSLRFFGRGILAFLFSMVAIGFRYIHTIGWIGGIVCIGVGIYTLQNMMYYGADMAEKFFVSPHRIVRGTFVAMSDGTEQWTNTPDEVSAIEVASSRWCFGYQFGGRIKRWRPEGHGVTTPIWRLDKFLNFPNLERSLYTENEEVRRQTENAKLQDLVLAAQHTSRREADPLHKPPASSANVAENVDKDGASGGSWFSMELLNPFQALGMVGQALMGNNSNEPSGRQSFMSRRRSSARVLERKGTSGHLDLRWARE